MGLVRLTAVSLALCGAACALTTTTIATKRPIVPGGVRSAGVPAAIVVEKTLDRRKDRKRIGVKKNGFGSELGAVKADGNVADWVHESVEATLARAGFRVGESSRDAIRVRLTLRELFVEPDVGFWAQGLVAKAVVDVEARLPSGDAYRRRFSGVHESTHLVMADSKREDAIEDAMNRMLSRVARGLAELAEGRPQ